MKSSEIRDQFLHFFESRDHLVLPSFSLVPQNDPTLLLIGAGMAPLKPYFTGEKLPPYPRVATCQKCVRTPDIEKVGMTARHATFFEMLGNFSFGDYFKEEAIAWSWELMTEGYKIPSERLYISIFENDDEAFQIWHEQVGIPKEKIYRLGREDNFWEIGQGPCGPCSEIYYDLGPELGCGKPDCAVGCDCDRYLEVWNLVFAQFNKEADGNYTTLKQKNIDTGAGLERLAVVLQGVYSLFEIDTVKPLLDFFAAKAGHPYGEEERRDLSLRIITEHFRGVAFMVADGVMPSNEGRGYVLRRILRRAVRHGKLHNIEPPFLYEALPLLNDLMGDVYPELRNRHEHISRMIKIEEERFNETLVQGTELLNEYIEKLKAAGETVLSGETAFKLYDTFGFPVDLTKEILAEQQLSMDEATYQKELEQQKDRARAAVRALGQSSNAAALTSLVNGLKTEFVGYQSLSSTSNLLAVMAPDQGKLLDRAEANAAGEEYYFILDKSPFYAESGGQIGDTGVIESSAGRSTVRDTFYGPGEEIVHRVRIEEGYFAPGDEVFAAVDQDRRASTARNHTATHLLHKALRDTLGDHVNQYGSYVAPDRLRFDFTHFSHLTPAELDVIAKTVNEVVMENRAVATFYSTMGEALERGATALFDEKYGDQVRIVQVNDYSMELCGGTHVSATGEIGIVKIISESSVGAGMRRIEALSGIGAFEYLNRKESIVDDVSSLLKCDPESIQTRLQEVFDNQKKLQQKLKKIQSQLLQDKISALVEQTDRSLGIPVLSAQVEAESMDELREYLDRARDKIGSGVVLLGAVNNNKVMLAAAVTRDLVAKGYHAGELIRETAKIVGGGGGGRPDLAQAGGKDAAKLPAALSSVLDQVKKQQDQV